MNEGSLKIEFLSPLAFQSRKAKNNRKKRGECAKGGVEVVVGACYCNQAVSEKKAELLECLFPPTPHYPIISKPGLSHKGGVVASSGKGRRRSTHLPHKTSCNSEAAESK